MGVIKQVLAFLTSFFGAMLWKMAVIKTVHFTLHDKQKRVLEGVAVSLKRFNVKPLHFSFLLLCNASADMLLATGYLEHDIYTYIRLL